MCRRVARYLTIVFGVIGCGAMSLAGAFWLLAALLFGNNPFDLNPFDNTTFDPAIWLEDAACITAGNRRAGMAEDLLRHRLQRGMAENEVAELLGSPEVRADSAAMATNPIRFSAEDRRSERVLVYYLGEELGGQHRGHWIDRAWLNLRFDGRGRYRGGDVFLPH